MRQDDFSSTATARSTVVVAFHLTDTGESFRVDAGEGVATVFPGSPDTADATVRLPQRVWLELVFGVASVGEALLADGVEVDGDLARFVGFCRRFTTTIGKARPATAGGENDMRRAGRGVQGSVGTTQAPRRRSANDVQECAGAPRCRPGQRPGGRMDEPVKRETNLVQEGEESWKSC